MKVIKTAVYGANGKMGRTLCQAILASAEFEMTFGVDRNPAKFHNDFPVVTAPDDYAGSIDLMIDFSHPSNLETILAYVTSRLVPTLIATTGLCEDQMRMVQSAGQTIPILYSPNTSLGISILNSILRTYTAHFGEGYDIEIVEKHHNRKIDAPSGTAKLFAETINKALGNTLTYVHGRYGQPGPRRAKEIGIHAVRGGSIAGEHTVIFAGEQEVIEIRHTALSKSLFAQHALRLCRLLVNAPKGAYTNDNLYDSNSRR